MKASKGTQKLHNKYALLLQSFLKMQVITALVAKSLCQ